MNQKVIADFACKIEDIESNQEISGLEFKKFTNQETDPKNLEQAIHNVLLGMELISVVENAYGEIEVVLSEVKQWVSPSLASNLDNTQKSDLETRIALKLKALDQAAETFTHKGQKLLDGSISASAKTDSHSFLVVGANGSPENRINLNTSLNIPSINSNTLGLGELSVNSPQKSLKGLMVLENALAIIGRLKQRSAALGSHLQEINQHLATAIENHNAANSAPDSYGQAREFLRMASDFIKKNKCEY
jgi:flagellin-like hook-associated protein FlgL